MSSEEEFSLHFRNILEPSLVLYLRIIINKVILLPIYFICTILYCI